MPAANEWHLHPRRIGRRCKSLEIQTHAKRFLVRGRKHDEAVLLPVDFDRAVGPHIRTQSTCPVDSDGL